MNFDGGFGCIPGAESHAGQVTGVLRKPYKIARFFYFWFFNKDILLCWISQHHEPT